MPRDLRTPNQSQSNSQENEKPQAATTNNSQSDPTSKEDEEFVDIDREDVEMQDPETTKPSIDSLDLHTFGTNVQEPEEDDDSEEEHDQMSSHPLLSMLTGRLGQRRRGSTHKWDALHPVTQVLSVANVGDCTVLEESAFPEHERCSREKFEYRLSRCPELSLGIFSRPTEAEWEGQEAPVQRRLIAHVVSTRTPSPSVTDASMGLPPDWKTNKSSLPAKDEEEPLGHQERGGTICIHSLAVAKEHQGIGLGTVLMKAYVQRIKDSKCADRLALLAHDHLVGFYTGLGFENMGPSKATFAGGGWINLVMEFDHEEEE